MKNKVCLGVVALILGTCAIARASVTIVALEPVYGNLSWAWSINERGQIVGASGNDPGFLGSDGVATVWQADGTGVAIGPPGVAYSNGRDINSPGQVAGDFVPNDGGTSPCTWEMGNFIPLEGYGRAYSINEQGNIAGENDWTPAAWFDGMLIPLDSRDGSAHSINSHNAIVGRVKVGSHFEAFVWQKGVLTTLGTNGAINSWAMSLNDSGTIVGFLTHKGNYHEAFVLSDGRLMPMGTFGFDMSVFWTVNNLGQVLCYTSNWDYRWDPPLFTDFVAGIYFDDRLTLLRDLLQADSGWTALEPYDINDQMQMVGYGRLHGQRRGFVISIHAGDVDGDTIANIDDLLAVIHSWGDCPAAAEACPADLSPLGGDGVIDIDDLLQVINNWD